MTELGIKLHQPYARGSIEAGAILTVRRLADPAGKVIKSWWSEEKPVAVVGDDGESGDYTTFELPNGGYYGIDITPPRGPHISREYLVQEGESRKEIIRMEGSPHEYLGWQQYAGILRNNPYREEADLSSAVSFPFEIANTDLVKEGLNRPIRRRYPTVFALMPPTAKFAWSWTKRAPRFEFPGFFPARIMDWPAQGDAEFVTWSPPMPTPDDGASLVNSLRRRRRFPRDDEFPRWICFEADRQVDLASVPWAWFGMDQDRGPAGEIRFLYDRVRTSSVDRRSTGYLNLSVQDQRWFGLLQFLASDRMSRAGELARELLRDDVAESALAGKVKGPLAAVAGGIVLVTQAKSTEEQKWDRWLENLTKWFPGIPDGAILLGSRALQRAKTFDDLLAAFENLHEGYSRGIPYFSAIIRILDMALAQISNDIPEAEALRRDIAFASSRVDPTQPFTVIRLKGINP